MAQTRVPFSATKLVLASGSVYRRQMLERLQWPFEVAAADIDETPRDGEGGQCLALRLADQKAATVAIRFPGAVILGCDQVAECDDRLLGKPGSADRALEQLSFTAGKDIIFHSGMMLRRGEERRQACVPTRVRMRKLSEAELIDYIERDKPFDCAGAMRSESLGVSLTEFIRSDDPTALIGLPMIRLTRMLADFGINVLAKPL